MSEFIPFEIQSEIIKLLPVKSIVQFRSVSKQWKSFIDNPEFIRTYHINHPNPHHHLLLQYTIDSVGKYTSIVDDNTFPQQKFPLTTPEPLNLLSYTTILGSVGGLLGFYGPYQDVDLQTNMVVFWNPSISKSVSIPIPNVFQVLDDNGNTVIGFGVCPDTNDPKLVKINVAKTPSICWEVQVFTFSSRVWKTVCTGAPFKSCDLLWGHVFIDGIIYWHSRGSFILSFDLKSEMFGQVCLPERLARTYGISTWEAKVNESLGLLEFYKEGEMSVCGVWMRKCGVNQPFTKIYTVKFEGSSLSSVLGFRKNGEAVIEMVDDHAQESQIEVYEPSSGRINRVGISGEIFTFTACSYVETLLLLDESNSIVH